MRISGGIGPFEVTAWTPSPQPPEARRMTIDDFLDALRQHRNERGSALSGWHQTNGHLRHGQYGPRCECPITFVANRTLDGDFRLPDYREAGEALRLSGFDIDALMESADSDPYPVRPLRARLLAAVGLSS